MGNDLQKISRSIVELFLHSSSVLTSPTTVCTFGPESSSLVSRKVQRAKCPKYRKSTLEQHLRQHFHRESITVNHFFLTTTTAFCLCDSQQFPSLTSMRNPGKFTDDTILFTGTSAIFEIPCECFRRQCDTCSHNRLSICYCLLFTRLHPNRGPGGGWFFCPPDTRSQRAANWLCINNTFIGMNEGMQSLSACVQGPYSIRELQGWS